MDIGPSLCCRTDSGPIQPLTVRLDSGGLLPEGKRQPFCLRGVAMEGGVQRRGEQWVEEGGRVESTPVTAERQLMEEYITVT